MKRLAFIFIACFSPCVAVATYIDIHYFMIDGLVIRRKHTATIFEPDPRYAEFREPFHPVEVD